MREVVKRRYTRAVEEQQELPDLIVIDGGKGQLSAAVEILQSIEQTKHIPVIGLAKDWKKYSSHINQNHYYYLGLLLD